MDNVLLPDLHEVTHVTDLAVMGNIIKHGLIDDEFSRDICRQQIFLCSQQEHDAFESIARARILADKQWDTYTTWEQGNINAAMACRSDLMQNCSKRRVSDLEVQDVQYRWENKLFTSVSEHYVLIGDAYCKNLFGFPVQVEITVKTKLAALGSTDFSYTALSSIVSGASSLSGCRGKLNGDRYVRVANQLMGMEVIDLYDPCVDMVERCLGRYYVIYPSDWVTKSIPVRRNGIQQDLLLESHPFLSLTTRTLEEISVDCRYEGVMLWDGKSELRCKKRPSFETTLEDGLVWEVVVINSVLTKHRPRYGKSPVTSAVNHIRSCVSMSSFMRWFSTSSSYCSPMKVNEASGVKTILWRITSGILEFGFVKEREDKPWDWVGGKLELGESVMDAYIREYQEEMKEPLGDPGYYLGVNADINFCSHIYIKHYQGQSPCLSWYPVTLAGPTFPSEVASWTVRHATYISSRLGACYFIPWYYSLRSGGVYVPSISPPLQGMDKLNQYVTRDYLSSLMRVIGGIQFPVPFSVLQFRARSVGMFITPVALRQCNHPDFVCDDDSMTGTSLVLDGHEGNLFPGFLLGSNVENPKVLRSYYQHVVHHLDRYMPLHDKIRRAVVSDVFPIINTWKPGRYFFSSVIRELSGQLGCVVDKSIVVGALSLMTRRNHLGVASFSIDDPIKKSHILQ